jgi:hypothetical protein
MQNLKLIERHLSQSSLIFVGFVFSLLSLVFCPLSLHSQTIPPPFINYQAVLYDVNNPIPNSVFANQSFQTFVNINDELGNLLYREEHYASTDGNGLITVKMGDGLYVAGPITNFNQIDWGTGKYYLVVDFNINGTISSTAPEQLVTVPYSFYSGRAGNGMTSVADNGNGTLTFTYANGATYTTPTLSGIQGPAGVTGPVGPAGPTGATGPQGPQGPQGIQGEIGPQGPIGLTGPQGPAGAIGPQGPSGPQGPVGATGPQGIQGIAGSNGNFSSNFISSSLTSPVSINNSIQIPLNLTFTATSSSAFLFFTASGESNGGWGFGNVAFRINNATLGTTLGWARSIISTGDSGCCYYGGWSCSYSGAINGLIPGNSYTLTVTGFDGGNNASLDPIINPSSGHHLTLTVVR